METEQDDIVAEEATVSEAGPLVVVGVPAFNEEKTIARVILKAQKYADKVVVCNDGSNDLTAEIAERLGAEVISHEGNMGYGVAIRSLFRRAKELKADVLVTLDGDGQHDPREIPNVVDPIVDGEADLVIGSRFIDERLAGSMPWYRRAGIKLINKVVNNSGKGNVKDAQSGFRAYNNNCLEALDMLEDGMGVSAEILINAKKQHLRICEVPSSCKYGGNLETSTKNPVNHLVEVLMSIAKSVVEDRPLTFLGIPGIVCLIIGAFFGAWMLQIYSLERRIVTNIALASVTFVLIGIFALFTAITLYEISRLAERLNNKG